ncbi:MAG: NDP-hexose 2,3-dehydratase family protein [Salinivirgaceae bacterium]|nr:NDP-hexose 2,3-dehydratase family protein [Salinivirgaceae bacterium]
MMNDIYMQFLKSAFSVNNTYTSTEKVQKWLKKQNEQVRVNINRIPFSKLKQWNFKEGKLCHDSGSFFSIDGINVKTNWGLVNEWQQPIINQQEIGYLGFITKMINGILYFLIQAKIEPGNVSYVQLSPTLQATRSNYTQVHKGSKPLYLEYFQNAKPHQILLDQLQSEQGSRFLRKRNRNIIIQLEGDIQIHENFIWLTLGQIKELLKFDNLVNMDTRTVISGIPFGSYSAESIDFFNFLGDSSDKSYFQKEILKSALTKDKAFNSIEDVITFITNLKSGYDLEISKIPLENINGWNIGENNISHEYNKYFKVIAVDVEIGNREVVKWSQPMIEPAQEGLCAFVCKKIDGIIHFAVQAKLECGNFDTFELAPTVQCLTGNYRQTKEGALPFLEYVLNAPSEQIIFDTLQSEEGGRFYKEQNRNRIVFAGEEIPIELPSSYIWMTLNQLNTFIKFNNYLNIQARSLIASISFI